MKIKAKVEVEIEVNGKLCGECYLAGSYWCNLYQETLLAEPNKHSSLRCQKCLNTFGEGKDADAEHTK